MRLHFHLVLFLVVAILVTCLRSTSWEVRCATSSTRDSSSADTVWPSPGTILPEAVGKEDCFVRGETHLDLLTYREHAYLRVTRSDAE